ncbi:unnamed protein product [Closterium sp. Yama58-4]|nr:unnamed protein product [Closterium sp. Yama58-4]
MSRMITRNGGARQTDGSSGVAVDKLKDSVLPADASASSAVKRTLDLFSEADKEALQPVAHGVKDAVRELLATGSGDNLQQAGDEAKTKSISKEATESLRSGKEDASTRSVKQDEEEEDDGYLSDDPEERYDAHANSEVAQRIRFAIVLLIPIAFKSEATRVQATLRALFNLWKKDLNMEIQATTKFQELSALSPAADHNFWTELRPHSVAAATAPTRAGGVAILCFREGVELEDVQCHPSGRLLHARLCWGARQMRVLAAYFPSQAPSRGSFLGLDFKEFAAGLPRGEQLVVAGDLNMIEDSILDKSNRQGVTGDNSRIKHMLSNFQVKDVFKELWPGKRVSHQRIPDGITDHKCGVRMRLVWNGQQETGPGVWRFPARLANRPGVSSAIADVVRRHEEGGSGDFDRLSKGLSARLRKYDKEEKERVRSTRRTLEKQVSDLQQRVMADPSDDNLQAVLTSRQALLCRYWDGQRSFLEMRTGLKVQLCGEGPTGFLSALVKSRKAKVGIKELVWNGVSHTDAKAILESATQHFREVFDESPGMDDEGADLQWTPRAVLDEASAEAIARDWTEEGVRKAIRELANDKSPGRDGLPKELFRCHWEVLKGPLMKMVRGFVATGKMLEAANEAVTVLLYKKGAETGARNYRPITLLTSIYKILAKVMATRMKAVLHQVISGEQYGFLPGKRLTDAVPMVADLIDAAKNKNKEWYIMMVDFEKAYDSVRRGYMLRAISRMGFPPRFVSWIGALHSDVHTRLCINGWTGEQIQMQKGVRQGYPLAPYLFLCAVEPLSRMAEARKLGIGEKGCERLSYIGYADDTTLLLNGEQQLKEVEKMPKEFAAMSGLKANVGKSAILPLGKNVNKQAEAGTAYKWVGKDEAERLLGVWVTPGEGAGTTWEKAFDRVASVLSKWQTKYLTTGARVTIINSYVLPVLLFQAQVYPPDDLLWKRVDTLVENSISANHADTEKHFRLWSGELMYAPREQGGLGIIDPKGRIDSVALRCVGLALMQRCPLRRTVTENAAGMEFGWATLCTHKAVLKGGLIKSRRWAKLCKVVLKSSSVRVPEATLRWEAEEGYLCYNTKITHKGKAPFGGQKHTSKWQLWKMRNMVVRKWDG